MSTNGLDQPVRVAQAPDRAGRGALRPLPLAGLAGACGVALMALYVLLLRTTSGQRLDQHTLDRRALATRPARYAVHDLLTTISVGMLVVVLGVLIGQAILRRRLPLALVAGAIVGGAALCTELLKHVLVRPYLYVADGPYGNTFPSGHTTVAFSVGIAATLLAPPRLRNAVAAGAVVYGTAVGIAVVAAAWHRPSDVVGAFLVVTGWSALVALCSARWFPGIFSGEASERRSPITPRDVLFGGLALAGGYAVALVAVIARDGGTIDWTLPGGTFIAACGAIAVAAALSTAALLVALRRSLRA